jgi:hypothetical protein
VSVLPPGVIVLYSLGENLRGGIAFDYARGHSRNIMNYMHRMDYEKKAARRNGFGIRRPYWNERSLMIASVNRVVNISKDRMPREGSG